MASQTCFIPIVSLGLLAVIYFASPIETAYAQELEPPAFANTPVGLNFLIGAYAYSKGTVGTDPSVPLTDTEVKLNSAVLAYVRTLDLWGRSGKVDLIIPYTWADGSAKVAGRARGRFLDSTIRDYDSPCCCTGRRRYRSNSTGTTAGCHHRHQFRANSPARTVQLR